MHIDSENARQLATMAREAGADVLEGNLSYPSRTGGWQLGDVDLGDILGRYRDQRLTVILVPAGKVETETVTCDVCGYIMAESDEECPRCKFLAEYTTDVERRIGEREQLFEDDAYRP
jgi:phage FluMu protein Com